MTTIRRHALITGRVQGVGFRWSARRHAASLGLAGWVRNLPDGRVEAEFEGPDEPVRAFAEWLREGPGHARVDDLQLAERDVTGEVAFIVR